jgi:hypothetical protein
MTGTSCFARVPMTGRTFVRGDYTWRVRLSSVTNVCLEKLSLGRVDITLHAGRAIQRCRDHSGRFIDRSHRGASVVLCWICHSACERWVWSSWTGRRYIHISEYDSTRHLILVGYSQGGARSPVNASACSESRSCASSGGCHSRQWHVHALWPSSDR